MEVLGEVSDESLLLRNEDAIAGALCSHPLSDRTLPSQSTVLRRRGSSSNDHLPEGNVPPPQHSLEH